jgi:hypothetical protein
MFCVLYIVPWFRPSVCLDMVYAFMFRHGLNIRTASTSYTTGLMGETRFRLTPRIVSQPQRVARRRLTQNTAAQLLSLCTRDLINTAHSVFCHQQLKRSVASSPRLPSHVISTATLCRAKPSTRTALNQDHLPLLKTDDRRALESLAVAAAQDSDAQTHSCDHITARDRRTHAFGGKYLRGILASWSANWPACLS